MDYNPPVEITLGCGRVLLPSKAAAEDVVQEALEPQADDFKPILASESASSLELVVCWLIRDLALFQNFPALLAGNENSEATADVVGKALQPEPSDFPPILSRETTGGFKLVSCWVGGDFPLLQDSASLSAGHAQLTAAAGHVVEEGLYPECNSLVLVVCVVRELPLFHPLAALLAGTNWKESEV